MNIQSTKNLLVLAAKQAWRHRRKTLLIAFCIGIGNLTLLLQLSQGHGQENAFMGSMIRSLSGHMQLSQSGSNSSTSLFEADILKQSAIKGLPGIESILQNTPQVHSIARRVRFGSMMSHGEENWSAFIVGAEAARERQVCDGIALSEGRFITAGSNEIVISASTARDRGLRLGDTVTILAGTATRSFNAMEFQIVGLTADTGISKFYSRMAYIPIERARKLVGLPADASLELVVRLRQTSDTGAVASGLRTKLAGIGATGVTVRTWPEMAGIFLGILAVSRAFQLAMAVFLGAVILILMFSNFSVYVIERCTDMATLQAIGYRKRELAALFISEALIVAAASAILGLSLGAILCGWLGTVGIPAFNEPMTYVFAGDRLFPILRAGDIMLLLFGTCVVAALAVLEPIRRSLGRDFVLMLNRS